MKYFLLYSYPMTFLLTWSFSINCHAPTNLFIKEKQCLRVNEIVLGLREQFAHGKLIHIIKPQQHDSKYCEFDLGEKELFDKWPVVITQYSILQEVGELKELPDVFIIFFNNYNNKTQVYNIIDRLIEISKSWNPSAKFLLVTIISNSLYHNFSKHQLVIDTINYLWKRNVFRVALIVSSETKELVSLFSSLPYSRHYNTCKSLYSSSQLQEINLIDKEITLPEIVGYQFETPDSFLGCPLVGRTFHFPPYSVADVEDVNGKIKYKTGIEVQLIKLMGNLYNFSVDILNVPSAGNVSGWIFLLPNGTTYLMLAEVLEYNTDVAFAGGIPPHIFFFNLSLTNAYFYNSVSWYVPGAELIPNWELALHTFNGVTWMCLILMFVMIINLYFAMNGFKWNKDERPVPLTMLAVFLGFSISLSKKTKLRLLLLTWSFFSLHITQIFTTRLFSVLAGNYVASGIRTVQELYDSEFKTCAASGFLNFYIEQTSGLTKDLLESARICESLDESVEQFLKFRNFSILSKDDHMDFLIDIERAHIRRIDEKFINYPVLMSVSKGSVFIGHLNRLILNITESGMVLKWLSDLHLNVKTKFYSRKGHNFKNKASDLLKLEDFMWIIGLFMGGQSIAIIVFVIEICCK